MVSPSVMREFEIKNGSVFFHYLGYELSFDRPNSQERFDIKRLILTKDKKGSKKNGNGIKELNRHAPPYGAWHHQS
jgi:hypothetical protein